MQIELKIDPQCPQPRIIVEAPAMTDEVSAIMQKLSEDAPLLLTGFRDDTPEVLEPVDILRLYASSGKVFATTSRGTTPSASGCMSWSSGWTRGNSSASPTRRSSI